METKSYRAQAKERGEYTYSTGRPCKRDHYPVRYVATGACVECTSIANKQYAAKNQEKVKAKSRKWLSKNKQRVSEYQKEYNKTWRLKNKDRMREYTNQWRKNNPEAQKAIDHRRRARKANSIGAYTAMDIKRIGEMQRHKCAYCKTDLNNLYHIDHIMPLVLGGSNLPSNLQLLCPQCNLRKQAKHPIDWANQIGLLL